MNAWDDGELPDDPDEVVRQMRAVLADPHYSRDVKSEALELLTNMAHEEAVAVLRWYRAHPDRGMALDAQLALIEADRLMLPPTPEPRHEALLDVVQREGDRLRDEAGRFPARASVAAQLAAAIRARGWSVAAGGQAMLLYRHLPIAFEALELVAQGDTLIGFWDRDDEERAWERIEAEEAAPLFDPLDEFHGILRGANLPWGLLVDISGDTLYLDLIHNLDMDHGLPTVDYLVRFPDEAPIAVRKSN